MGVLQIKITVWLYLHQTLGCRLKPWCQEFRRVMLRFFLILIFNIRVYWVFFVPTVHIGLNNKSKVKMEGKLCILRIRSLFRSVNISVNGHDLPTAFNAVIFIICPWYHHWMRKWTLNPNWINWSYTKWRQDVAIYILISFWFLLHFLIAYSISVLKI